MQENARALKPLVQQTMQAARAGLLSAQDISNIAYGVAHVKSSRYELLGTLFAALATAAEHCTSDFNQWMIANTAWAFATARQKDSPLFAVWAKAAKSHMATFKPQNLAKTAWAFAKTGKSNVELFMALARASEQLLGDFKA